ncbi:MAG: hypothetical protein H6830_09045 [Planctomycetes bacterium]|nr:hypothetical protein [Planctomycetota bacterium]MCB9907848.1 hypothetical protein [Planctomycetota bacterium]MCB9909868.1 hypothetical protein [Planctomycetota bacterium]MCB9913392.1 hypothetical protein [Planctomycetota bacterium]HPF14336.1 hypothetical protein [Planctomycetota bacterium]
MTHRILLLAKSRLDGEWFGDRGGSLPIAPLVFQGLVASALFWLVRGDLDGLGHGVFALTLLLALTLLSLLGELAPLLASDPAEEWIGALPVTAREVRLSKILVCLVVTLAMSLGVLVPAMVLAPSSMAWPDRFLLMALGAVQVVCTTAFGLLLQRTFQGSRTGWLVLFQAILFVGLFVGFVAGLGHAQALSGWEQPAGWWLVLPSGWFAAPLAPGAATSALSLLGGCVLACSVVLWKAPFPAKTDSGGTSSILGNALYPLAKLARRTWVRPSERAVFDWIYAALPAEKDFALRTYPLMAIPFAFLFLGADGVRAEGQGLLAILSFAPLTYLPILLLFVPTTQTPAARAMIDSTPMTALQEREGAIKAITVRILVPLYALLMGVLVAVAGWALAWQLIPPALAFTVLMLRPLWARYVEQGPLSTPAAELGGAWRDDLTGGMFFVALVSVALALLTWKYVPGPWAGLGLGLGLFGLQALWTPTPPARQVN